MSSQSTLSSCPMADKETDGYGDGEENIVMPHRIMLIPLNKSWGIIVISVALCPYNTDHGMRRKSLSLCGGWRSKVCNLI